MQWLFKYSDNSLKTGCRKFWTSKKFPTSVEKRKKLEPRKINSGLILCDKIHTV